MPIKFCYGKTRACMRQRVPGWSCEGNAHGRACGWVDGRGDQEGGRGRSGRTGIKLPADGLRFLMDRYSEQIVLTQARINGGTLISTVIANLHGYELCCRAAWHNRVVNIQ
jgi:hypothetical protein